ncbi:MAG: helix-turn-helix transcriptional regulator [Gemmatimonadaceae bacterium]
MKKAKRARLEARGWRLGSAADFLGLSAEEAALVETKLVLSQALRRKRVSRQLTQQQLARRLKSSQSRVAKMEAADKSVSVDLLLKGLFALGAKPGDIGRALQLAAA